MRFGTFCLAVFACLTAHGLDLKAQAPLLLMGNMAYGDEESLELLIKRGIDVNTRIS